MRNPDVTAETSGVGNVVAEDDDKYETGVVFSATDLENTLSTESIKLNQTGSYNLFTNSTNTIL